MTKQEAISELTRCADICPTTPLAEACRYAVDWMRAPNTEFDLTWGCIGERIRHYRTSKNWSIAELGRRMHMPPQTIGKYEHGQTTPKYKNLIRIANALEINPMLLMDSKDNSWLPGERKGESNGQTDRR